MNNKSTVEELQNKRMNLNNYKFNFVDNENTEEFNNIKRLQNEIVHDIKISFEQVLAKANKTIEKLLSNFN